MSNWQLILAWVLYLVLVFVVAYRRSTSFNEYTALLNKTDWVFFWIYMGWFLGLGLLITSLII